MPQGNWQSDAAYDDKRALDPPGYAFEYLRRNRSFVRDARRLEGHLKRGTITRHMREAYARRWGVRFREVHTRRRTSDDPVDDDGTAERRAVNIRSHRTRPLPQPSCEIPAQLDRRATGRRIAGPLRWIGVSRA